MPRRVVYASTLLFVKHDQLHLQKININLFEYMRWRKRNILWSTPLEHGDSKGWLRWLGGWLSSLVHRREQRWCTCVGQKRRWRKGPRGGICRRNFMVRPGRTRFEVGTAATGWRFVVTRGMYE